MRRRSCKVGKWWLGWVRRLVLCIQLEAGVWTPTCGWSREGRDLYRIASSIATYAFSKEAYL